MTKKRIFLIAVFCAIALTVFLFATAISIVNYGEVDEKQKADVAIVLGAATYNGEPSPVYRERINHAIWLYENNYADYIIMTGGKGKGAVISDAYIAKQYAISKCVPSDKIFIEQVSTITEENLEQAKIVMDSNLFKTVIIVSDPLHMKRAMLMAKDYGIKAFSSPTPTTMYKSLKTKLPFLLREEFFYIGYSIVRIFK